MPNGDLSEYIENNPNVDRLALVGPFVVLLSLLVTLVTRYLMLQGASVTFTPAMWFTGKSKEYVVILTLISPSP
jgi:hypothetical protein